MSDRSAHEAEGQLEPIAIVGMACKVPGADNLEKFWQNLVDGVESIRDLSEEEMLEAGTTSDRISAPGYVRRAPVLDGVEEFDAARFGFNRREAEILDPQHRLFLETAAAALDHAGYDPDRYDGEIGVYGGAGAGEYGWYHLIQNKAVMNAVGHMAVALANNPDYLTTLVSYRLNLRGPSVNVHTACSTGLVAVHLACEAVRNGECDMALAGAASIELTQKQGYQYHEGGILSPDGHCRTFDASAQGTLWGSGAGIVVLKRLSDALEDGDTIHALIRGSAINNDGADKAGFSAPSVSGQAEAISQALGVAGVDATTIDYVEGHGTATSIGDPIEVTALNEVFGPYGGELGSTRLGSVKPNIGHLAAAAGVVGLIKTVLSLENELLPRTIHFENPHPKIDFAAGPFRVLAANEQWPRTGTPRRAGVSSFGMGGTNSHAIVEEAPQFARRAPSRRPEAVVLSARTQSGLDTLGSELVEHLERHPETELPDLAHTLQHGRAGHEFRRAVVCTSAEDAAGVLAGRAPRRLITGRAAERQTVFMFPGQGVQRVGMIRDLYAAEPVVREAVDTCSELLEPELGFDLRTVMFASEDEAEAARVRLDDTSVTQPALFVVEYALAQLWISRGVSPDAMIGHSLGEYVAACIAGVFSLESGLRLIAARGRMMSSCEPGSMIAVHCDEAELGDLAVRQLSLAAINGPQSCTVAGPFDATEALAGELEEIGVPVTRLRTSHAFHSTMMEPARAGLASAFAQEELHPPLIPIVSNVSGEWLTAEQATSPDYWASHMCSAVRFGQGLRLAITESSSVLVEVGPGSTLAGLARLQLTPETPDPVASIGRGFDDDCAALLAGLARVWTLGVEVDWESAATGERRRRIPLPGQPFERERYWIDEVAPAAAAAKPKFREGKLPLEDWFTMPGWRQTAPLAAVAVSGSGSASGSEDAEERGGWVVFRDEHGVADGLAERLRARGDRVVTVSAGPQRAELGADAHVIRPAEPADYEDLLDALLAEGELPSTIVHAWNVGTASDPVQLTVERGFGSLVLLAQALAGCGEAEGKRIEVVTSDAQDVTGGDLLAPAAAAVAGPCKVFPIELAGLRCRHVDLPLASASGSVAAAVTALVGELTGTDDGETAVAYRAGKRWVPTLEPVRIEQPLVEQAPLREQGVYVITGGLGGIGLSVAEDLARRVQAKLVLLGRSPLPDRSEWPSLAKGRDRQARRLKRLLAIESLGAEVLALSADVTDAAEMARVRDEAIVRFGAVHGVIHAAGVAGGTMVEAQSPEISAAVLGPKIAGTLAVAAAFAQTPLDFLVLCSSVTAVAGGLGQVDYCAGNSFMDAFARSRAAAGEPVYSLNWGGWLEVGMAVETEAPAGFRDMQRGHKQLPVEHPMLDSAVRIDDEQKLIATVFLESDTHWALDEHRIHGTPVLPGTGYLELARAAFDREADGRPVELRDVVFVSPLPVPDGERREVRVVIQDGEDGSRFRIESLGTDGWALHARGSVGWGEDDAFSEDVDEIKARCPRRRADADVEESASGMLSFGPRWSNLARVWEGEEEELALLEAGPLVAAELHQFGLHPAILDEATSFGDFAAQGGQYLPLGYGQITVHRPMPARLYSHLRHRGAASPGVILCDVTLLDESGAGIAEICDFMLRKVDSDSFRAADRQDGSSPPVTVDDEIGIRPAEGAEALLRVLGARTAPQVVISAMDLGALVASVAHTNVEAIAEGFGAELGSADGAGGEAPAEEYVEPSTELERMLVGLWEEATGTRRIGVAHDFFDIGGNSLVAVQLMSRVRTATGVKLPMRSLFESPTISAMAAAVEACGELAVA